jgi:hypothetical protein
MNVRRFALIFGIIYLVVGIAGFVPQLLRPPPPDAPQVAVGSLYGFLFGLFPVNVLHTIVHLLIGIWGVVAAKSLGAAVTYARSLAVIYGVLAILGLIPGANTIFGLIPIHGHDVWLHAGSALIAAYFGFAKKPEAQRA